MLSKLFKMIRAIKLTKLSLIAISIKLMDILHHPSLMLTLYLWSSPTYSFELRSEKVLIFQM